MKTKACLIFIVSVLLLVMSGCRPAPPNEERIKRTLPNEITKLSVNNPFYEYEWESEYIEDNLDVLSVKIEKRQTNEKDDTAYCVIDLQNEFYHFTKYLILNYVYYDEGGWMLENWTTYREDAYEILKNPFEENAVERKMNFLEEEPNAKAISCSLEGDTITYRTQYKKKSTFCTEEGERIDTYTFNGTSWISSCDISNVNRIWDISGEWIFYKEEPDSFFKKWCIMNISESDIPNSKAKGTIKYMYARESFGEWNVTSDEYRLEEDCDITIQNNKLILSFTRSWDRDMTITFEMPEKISDHPAAYIYNANGEKSDRYFQNDILLKVAKDKK